MSASRKIRRPTAPPSPAQSPGDADTPALARDPFAEHGPDLLAARLDDLEGRGGSRPPLQANPQANPQAKSQLEPHPFDDPLRPLPPRQPSGNPALAEVELADGGDLWDQLVPERARRALTSLSHLLEGENAYDRFGFSPETARKALPWFHALYRYYFRVESRGHENLPERGRAVLASNHAGLLPADAAMTIMDVMLHTDPPRLLRAIVDRWAGELPFVNVFYARVGQVVGTHENFADLLADEQLVLVFPEGARGVTKPISERYRLQPFHVGFVEHALRARAPIIPMAVVGSDDQAPILFDLKSIAKRFGLPALPITPTFPWFGPLGLLPYPVRYRIVYGEALPFHERFGPEAAEDAQVVRTLAAEVRRAVQRLIENERGVPAAPESS